MLGVVARVRAAHGAEQQPVAPPHAAVHHRNVLQRRQHRRAVAVDAVVVVAGERIVLLHVAAVARQIAQPDFAQPRHQIVAAVVHQRVHGALIDQALTGAAPVVHRIVDEEQVVNGRGGHGQLRPEFVRVEQMALNERPGHAVVEQAQMHAAQIDVVQRIDGHAVPVAVEACRAGLVPQMCLHPAAMLRSLVSPVAAPVVAQQVVNFGKRGGHVIAVAGVFHGLEGQPAGILRRRLAAKAAVPRAETEEAGAVVLAGIPDAPFLGNAVGIAGAILHDIAVEVLHRAGHQTQIALVRADPVAHAQRLMGKVEALNPVVMGHHAQHPVGHVGDHARHAAVPALILHEDQQVVQAHLHVALGVHLAAHGLGFQPDVAIVGTLDEHAAAVVDLDVVLQQPFAVVEHPFQFRPAAGKFHARAGQRIGFRVKFVEHCRSSVNRESAPGRADPRA